MKSWWKPSERKGKDKWSEKERKKNTKEKLRDDESGTGIQTTNLAKEILIKAAGGDIKSGRLVEGKKKRLLAPEALVEAEKKREI